MPKVTLFLKSTCTSCRDVRALVRELGADVVERDYARKPLERAEVEQIVALAGGSEKVLNTRHAEAKARDWINTAPDAATFVDAVLKEPNLLRRPILVKGKKLVIGKDEPKIRNLLG